jgi:RNA polymerase sigma-70 factor, ECF subfamily
LADSITQEEFIRLIDANKGLIHKVCHLYGHTPENKKDLYQEIVVQLWSSLPSFRNESKFTTWMYRVALNTAIAGLKKKGRYAFQTGLEDHHINIAEESHLFDPEEQVVLLYAAIQQLTLLEKAIVMLYLEDKSYEEMEEVLGIRQGNLRVKMNRIREKLKTITANQHLYGS